MPARLWTFVAESRRYSRDRYMVPPDAEIGELVVLWRSGRGGGVVAVGSIAELRSSVNPIAPLSRFLADDHPDDVSDSRASIRDMTPNIARVEYTGFYMSNPLTAEDLARHGLHTLVRAGKSGQAGYRRPVRFAPLIVSDGWWAQFTRALQADRISEGGSAPWPIAPGTVLYRSEVHDFYGGPRGSAECSRPRTTNDLLFVDRHADDPELTPKRARDALTVAGQALQSRGGNPIGESAIADHLHRARALRVFETDGTLCRYVGEFVVDQETPIERWVDAGRRFIYPRHRYPMVGSASIARSGPEPTDYLTPILRIHQLDGIDAFALNSSPLGESPLARLAVSVSTVSGVAPEPTRIAHVIRGLIDVVQRDPEAAASIEDMNAAAALNTLLQRRRQQVDLEHLRAIVADPSTKEADLQKVLQDMLWLFGGGYLQQLGRRNLTTKDQLDLALVRPDGSLHGVEIKQARIPRLLKRHRDHCIPGREVHEALWQATNYLVSLDEQRHTILQEHKIDTRRATMTVIIGSAQHTDPLYSPKDIAETFRIQNASNPRIQVATYDQLIDDAQSLLLTPDGTCV